MPPQDLCTRLLIKTCVAKWKGLAFLVLEKATVMHSTAKVLSDLTSLPQPSAPVFSLSFLVHLTVQAALAPTHSPRLSLEKQQVIASSVAALALYSSHSGTASARVVCVCLCTPKTYLASSLGGAPLSEDLGDTLRWPLLVAAEKGILRKGPC